MVFRGQPRHSDRHLRSCPLTRQLPLSPLHPTRSALFFAMERSQALSHQSLAHSFPCNGGGRVSVQGLSVAARLPHLPRASEGASSGSSPWSGFLCFQQLTYPKRIGHPERSEGSLLISFQQLTNCSELSPDSGFLCFHTFANRPICKPFVLIKLQQYPGVCGDFIQLAPTLLRSAKAHEAAYRGVTNAANPPLYFQAVARCSSRNSFRFTILHCCPGVVGPQVLQPRVPSLSGAVRVCTKPLEGRHLGSPYRPQARPGIHLGFRVSNFEFRAGG
jgi:hypothetical protein